jgi:hypothetical protein
MTRILIVLAASTLLVACEAKIKGPSAEISTPKLTIYDGGGGHFCPPGQAKKGYC